MLRAMVRAIERMGDGVLATGRQTYRIVSLFGETLSAAVSQGKRGYGPLLKQITGQILFTGVEALWLVSVVGLIAGVTIVIQGMTRMPQFGVGAYFGSLLIVGVVRELSPFFTAFIVIGRSGAALSVYIGNMRVTQEIAALEVMGVEPVNYLVVPAFWGMVISMVCLNFYFSIVAIVGGLAVADVMGATGGVPLLITLAQVLDALRLFDVGIALGKSALFGIVVAVVSSYYGLEVRSIREVPQASIKSVVLCMGAIIVINIIVTALTFNVH